MLTRPKSFLTPKSLDFVNHDLFDPCYLDGKVVTSIPSVGIGSTNLTVGRFHQIHEHRQECEVISCTNECRAFVTRYDPLIEEDIFRQGLFGDSRPPHHSLANVLTSEDIQFSSQLANNIELLDSIVSSLVPSRDILIGYHETPDMEIIADGLGMRYFGNSRFAKWAGSKRGLQQFANEIGVPTPHTFALDSWSDISRAALSLQQIGYERMVIKANHSIGGQGHACVDIAEFAASDVKNCNEFLPPYFSFAADEGGIAQGWLEESDVLARIGVNLVVGFDGENFVASAVETDSTATQFVPIAAELYETAEPLLKTIFAGYQKYDALGPHSVNFMIVTEAAQDRYQLPSRILFHDENTRPGATRIGHEWYRCLTQFSPIHSGVRLENVYPRNRVRFRHVIEFLESHNLLLKRVGEKQSGIFPYNGAVFEEFPDSGFWILAISGSGDYLEAEALADKVRQLFSATPDDWL